MKLICLPYAGGSAQILKNRLHKYLKDEIEVVLVEPPGHGSCFGEKLITNFDELIKLLMLKVVPEIEEKEDYALLGYSMGSRLVYALYYEIIRMKLKKPAVMFFCSAIPPKIPYERKNLDREFIILEMKRLGGTEEEVLSNKQLMNIFVPIMRADMQVLYSYVYRNPKEKIKVPVVVLFGRFDDDVIGSIYSWNDYVEGKCEFYGYADGHFFINKYYREIAEVINKKYVQIHGRKDCLIISLED